jgi:sigma-B regulation protein RsbU (phosphoserine phosphatase)
MTMRWRPVLAAASAAVAVYAAVHRLQELIAADVDPRAGGIRSASDITLGVAFATALYLWLALRETRAALTMVERSQVVLETQLSLAAQVQRRLLPRVRPDGPDIHWATRLEPAWKIGGDFYDYIPARDGHTLLLVGDVSGKGIPAALLQASAHALFRTYAGLTTHPAELLRLVSREVFAETGGELYLTCVAVHIDAARRTICYVNAGHPAGLLLRDGGRRLLDAGGPPLGMFAETTYQSATLSVADGELGVIVTDGITEAIDREGVSAVDRLTGALSMAAAPLTPESACDVLMSLASNGAGPVGVQDWDDDKTVVAFIVRGTPISYEGMIAPPDAAFDTAFEREVGL